MIRRSTMLRATGVVALGISALVVGCVHLPRRARRPAPGADSARVATKPDTTKRDTVRAARPDSARDTTRRVAVDSARKPAPPRRRDTDDPTARCREVDFNDNPPTARLQNNSDAAGKVMTFVGGGVVARCHGIKNRLQSDSAEYYQGTGTLFLVNNVVYDEPGRVHLTSNRLTYFTNDERIVAEGNVVVTMPTGTTMTGPNAEYLRDAPALRDRSRLNATGRPVLRVVSTPPRDSAAPTTTTQRSRAATTRDTATIIANTIIDEGDSLVYASGQVQIVRPDVVANSDSATFDQGTELAHLVNNAQIQGQRGRPFTLSGKLIDLFSKQRDLTRVVSRGSAHVISEELDLKSDTVDLRLRDSRVDRAYAWGPSRATAVSPERDVTADSIEAVLPGQRIRELHAVRRAVARSVPDSTKIVSKERDVLSGDTIVAHFDTMPPARDTTKNPPVRQIVAAGHATSLFQIASSEGRTSPPGINYVRGRLITVAFDSGQVQTVTVTDSASGVYLEPSTDTTSDSTARPRARATTPRRQPSSGGFPSRRPESISSSERSPSPDSRNPAERRRAVLALSDRIAVVRRPTAGGAR